MLRVLEDWSRTAWRPTPRAALVGVQVALVAVLALQGARLVWRIVEPRGSIGVTQARSPRVAPAVDLAILGRFDPFFRISSAPQGGAAPSDDFKLFGVRADGRGGGSAIVGTSDGRQGSYLVGEEIAPGVVLRAVAVDHAFLSRGGGRIRLDFAAPSSVPSSPVTMLGPPPAPPPPALGASATVDPKQFLAAASLTPRTVNGQASGYRVMGRGKSDQLAAAGLQDGDVLLSVEGAPLNAERLTELPELLAQSQEVELRVERDGQIMTTRLKMAPR